MPVIFAGGSAIWMYRSDAMFEEVARGAKCTDVVGDVTVVAREVSEAAAAVEHMLGGVWHGDGPFEVLSPRDGADQPDGIETLVRAWRPFDRIFAVRGVEGVYVVDPELALEQVSATLDPIGVALLCDELCGTYRASVDENVAMRVGRSVRMSADGFRSHVKKLGPSAGRSLREAAELVVDGCTSPLDAKLSTLMTLPAERGGCGLEKPRLHASVVLGPKTARKLGVESVRVRALWSVSTAVLGIAPGFTHSNRLFFVPRRSYASRVLAKSCYDVAEATRPGLYDADRFASVAGEIASTIDPAEGPDFAVDARFRRMHARIMFAGDPLDSRGRERKGADLRIAGKPRLETK